MNTQVGAKIIGRRSLPRRRVVITMAGVMLAIFLASLDQTIVGTAMPRIIADLGGFAHYTWVTTAYLISSTVIVPITGKLTDIYGRKWFYIIGIAIFIVGSFLSGFSQSMAQIIAFRAVQGVGAGIMMANAFIAVADLFPPAERGKYQGLISGVFGLSSIIGPMLGGFITDNFSWHWVFYINIPLGILVIVLFVLFFPNYRPDDLKHQIDYKGMVTMILAVVPAMLALAWGGGEYPWVSIPIIGMFAFSAAMGVLFLNIEKRSEEPIVPLWIFRNRIVTLSMLVIFCTGFGMFGAIIFIPLFFQGVLGVSATASGGFLTPMMLGIVAGSFISGQILARRGGHYRLQGIFGIALMALGMMLLSRMTVETSYTRVVVSIILTGFGLGSTFPLYVIAIQNVVPHNVLGAATSSILFFRSIGGAFGLAIFGSVMNTRFAAEFTSGLPAAIKAIIPPERLASLVRNPQVLVSVEAQAQLRGLLERIGPPGVAIYEPVLQLLRQALSTALSEVFLIGFFVIAIAFIANLFIREVPLRK